MQCRMVLKGRACSMRQNGAAACRLICKLVRRSALLLENVTVRFKFRNLSEVCLRHQLQNYHIVTSVIESEVCLRHQLGSSLRCCRALIAMQQDMAALAPQQAAQDVFRGLALAAALTQVQAQAPNWCPGLRLTNSADHLQPAPALQSQICQSAVAGGERLSSSRRRHKRKRCRDDSQSSAAEEDADSDPESKDNQRWSRNYTKLGGSNVKTSYPRGYRFRIAAEILGPRLQPLKHSSMSLKELDKVLVGPRDDEAFFCVPLRTW